MSVKVRVKGGKGKEHVGGYLYLDVIVNRKHHWKALHIQLSSNPVARKEQWKLAERCRVERERQLVNNEWGFIDDVAGEILLIDYVKKADFAQKGKPLYTAIKYLEQYKDGGRVKLVAVNSEWVQDYQRYLDSLPLKPSSKWLYERLIRQAVNKAIKERIITVNPFLNVKALSCEYGEKEPLTAQEVKAIEDFDTSFENDLFKDVKRAFVFACYTGFRVSDLKTLTWGDIRRVIAAGKVTYWVRKQQVKTKNFVDIPLAASAVKQIVGTKKDFEHIGDRGLLLFPYLDTDKSGTTSLRYLGAIAKACNISKKVTWHIGRHTFATLLGEGGESETTIQRMMGHTKVDMSLHYAKTTANAKTQAISLLEQNIEEAPTDDNALDNALSSLA